MRRWWLAGLLYCTLLASAHAAPAKVLRIAFAVAETGFDPAQIGDIYSRTVTSHLFEAPYGYDHLARPAVIKPLTAAGMPEHSVDYRTWTVTLRPGIYFADDPAFKGKPRELVAQDYVFALKRFADPAMKSPGWTSVEADHFVGLDELRQDALRTKQAFNYDREIEGARALSRYVVQFRVTDPRPRFPMEYLADSSLFGAVAREVVEAYGDKIMEHPVGTGPFVLKQWRRSSLIVLERNPQFRELSFDAQPAADDLVGQAYLARNKGKRLPLADRVEVSIIDEQQPRWLAFLNGQVDVMEQVPDEFVNMAMPNGVMAPNLAKRGVQGQRTVRASTQYTFFNMDDPTVGGYTPERVALRRAISLGMDIDREIRLGRRGQGIAAHSPLNPHTSGYDAAYRSENGVYDLPRAKALLDLYGYVDRDGDGWRDQPDGAPLTLEIGSQPDQRRRQMDELMRRDMDALGLRLKFKTAKWPENLKAARAGKLMMWTVGGSAASPDGQSSLARYNSAQIGGQNLARFKLPTFDEIFKRMQALPDGPERDALFLEAKRYAVAYMPYKVHVHLVVTDLTQPWLLGYKRPLFWLDFWQYVDIDEAKRPVR
jgi:ABC-type transport system substrate-binding protein